MTMNAQQLRDELSRVFDDLRHGVIEIKHAAELANVAGKMISSAKVQVEYMALHKQAHVIPFLEKSSD